jgi:hypothetical protein
MCVAKGCVLLRVACCLRVTCHHMVEETSKKRIDAEQSAAWGDMWKGRYVEVGACGKRGIWKWGYAKGGVAWGKVQVYWATQFGRLSLGDSVWATDD